MTMERGAVTPSTSVAPNEHTGADETGQDAPMEIHTCSRLGRTANPPGLSVSDWWLRLRHRRRRCPGPWQA